MDLSMELGHRQKTMPIALDQDKFEHHWDVCKYLRKSMNISLATFTFRSDLLVQLAMDKWVLQRYWEETKS
jgi:hypothetical protein